MSNPMTGLDFAQVLKTSFDEEGGGRLKVTTVDSEGNEININPDGSINVEDIDIPLSAVNTSIEQAVSELQILNSNVDVDLSTRASEATLSAVNAKLANNYGASTTGLRTAAQIGNASGVANFGAGVTGAQTLRTTSNITRNGTELSYNAGVPDANTLRTASIQVGADPNGTTVIGSMPGIDNANSSSTPLLANATFTGTWKDLSQYVNISLMVKSDVASASNGLRIQFSTDGTTITRDLTGTYLVDANGLYLTVPVESKYYRIIYTNGPVNQNTFAIQAMLDTRTAGSATVPINFPINDSNSVIINRAVITGKSTDGTYVNQRSNGISTGNSTSALLGPGATFTGVWEDILGYSNITQIIYTNQASATDGFKIQYSSDGINVDAFDTYTVTPNEGHQYSTGATSKYFRVIYVNGPVAQTEFRLQTIYHVTPPKSASHRIDDSISGQNDAELFKAVLTGRNPDGIFDNVSTGGVVSSNSSTTPLSIGGVFQGPYFDTSSHASVSFFCNTDKNGQIDIETSDDGIAVIRTTTIQVVANVPFYLSQTPVGKFVRIRFSNTSGVAQTQFRLQTMLKMTPISPTAATISTALNSNSIALNTRSILSGQQENGIFSNVGLSNTGSIKVAVTDRPSEVRNRVKVEKQLFNTTLTTTPVVLHTPAAGKTLYVESMIISALNTANTLAEWRIANGGIDKISYLIADKTSGSPASGSSASPSLPEPIPFNVNFNVRSISGTIQLSIYILGYEE